MNMIGMLTLGMAMELVVIRIRGIPILNMQVNTNKQIDDYDSIQMIYD